ncbi:hypothetical protein V2S66_23920 [Streptomyces sp. V4-01]|uniref:SH3 domain-containing protein n=1 Tax=Actinacidiphila polyblastidii TaxID=3110430 RepID=A0ABU7PGR8_9ACTN|nr:hypothetical protein [Streptomyces sp. V4-01]
MRAYEDTGADVPGGHLAVRRWPGVPGAGVVLAVHGVAGSGLGRLGLALVGRWSAASCTPGPASGSATWPPQARSPSCCRACGYQSREHPWALGVAAVVRGRVGAVAAVAGCCLIAQVPLLGDALREGGQDRDALATPPCFGTASASRGGQGYSLLWLGSSVNVCRGLQDGMVGGSGRLAAVDAGATAALRSGPSTGDQVLRDVPPGTLGRVDCVTADGPADGDELWAHADILGSTGYLAAARLDDGAAVGGAGVGRCEGSASPTYSPTASPSDPFTGLATDTPYVPPSDGGSGSSPGAPEVSTPDVSMPSDASELPTDAPSGG